MQKTSMLGGVVAYAQVARADARGMYSDSDMREAVCVCMCSFRVSFLNDTLCAGLQADTTRLSILVNA
jgi:hypothetical protein